MPTQFKKTSKFLLLPDELLLEIMLYLPISSMLALASASKKTNAFVKKEILEIQTEKYTQLQNAYHSRPSMIQNNLTLLKKRYQELHPDYKFYTILTSLSYSQRKERLQSEQSDTSLQSYSSVFLRYPEFYQEHFFALPTIELKKIPSIQDWQYHTEEFKASLNHTVATFPCQYDARDLDNNISPSSYFSASSGSIKGPRFDDVIMDALKNLKPNQLHVLQYLVWKIMKRNYFSVPTFLSEALKNLNQENMKQELIIIVTCIMSYTLGEPFIKALFNNLEKQEDKQQLSEYIIECSRNLSTQ